MASEFASGFFREQLGHRRCRGKLNFTSRSVTLMTMWEGVDLAQRWFVWEHQSLSIGMRGYWSRIDCHAELFRRVEEISSVVEVVIWWGNKGERWEHFEGLCKDFCREGPTNPNINPNAVQTFTEMSDFFSKKSRNRNPKLKRFLK